MVAKMGETFERTGHPADLLSSAYLSVGTVLDAFDQLDGLWDQFTDVRILAPLSCDPVISVERDERVTRVDLSAVLRRFVSDRTGQPTVRNLGQVMDGLRCWVDTLPVSDREAAAHGIRLVTWADPARRSLVLDAVVPRGKTLTSWTPSATLTARAGNEVRASATAQALAQLDQVECAPDGTVLIWRHHDPRLSGVILADPDLALRWQTGPDLVCVYIPGFPVVGASPAAALRLAEETMVDHRLLTFLDARQLRWRKS
jgi:hypothetical protein